MSLQLVVQADKEIKHLVAQLVRLVKYDKRRVRAVKRLYYAVHLVAHTAAYIFAQCTQQLVYERRAVPILAAHKVVHVLPALCVALYGFCLAAACKARNGYYKAFVFSLLHEELHAPVRARLHYLPRAGVVPYLGGHAAPQLVTYGVPLSRQHLADRCRTYAVKAAGCLVLAAHFLAVFFQPRCDLLFLVLYHFNGYLIGIKKYRSFRGLPSATPLAWLA